VRQSWRENRRVKRLAVRADAGRAAEEQMRNAAAGPRAARARRPRVVRRFVQDLRLVMAFLPTTFRPFGSCLMRPRARVRMRAGRARGAQSFPRRIIDDTIHLTAGNDEVCFHNFGDLSQMMVIWRPRLCGFGGAAKIACDRPSEVANQASVIHPDAEHEIIGVWWPSSGLDRLAGRVISAMPSPFSLVR